MKHQDVKDVYNNKKEIYKRKVNVQSNRHHNGNRTLENKGIHRGNKNTILKPMKIKLMQRNGKYTSKVKRALNSRNVKDALILLQGNRNNNGCLRTF